MLHSEQQKHETEIEDLSLLYKSEISKLQTQQKTLVQEIQKLKDSFKLDLRNLNLNNTLPQSVTQVN